MEIRLVEEVEIQVAIALDPAARDALARAGTAAVEAAGGATERAMAALEPFICQLKIAGRFAS